MGIDVEQRDPDRYDTISSQLSERESGWVKACVRDKLEVATALWVAKEALSKALRSGLDLARLKSTISPNSARAIREFGKHSLKILRSTEPGFGSAHFTCLQLFCLNDLSFA